MENFNSMSNEELREKLLHYGFPNMPITNNTRGLIVKKLVKYIENEKVKLRQSSKRVASYSSGEDSENENANKSTSSDRVRKNPTPRTYNTGNHRQYSISSSLNLSSTSQTSRNGDFGQSDIVKHSYYPDSNNSSNIENDHALPSVNPFNDVSNDYTKRLLRFRNSTVNNETYNNGTRDQTYTPRYIQHSTNLPSRLSSTNITSRYSSSITTSPAHVPISESLSRIYRKIIEQYQKKQSFIPFLLVSVFVLFFAILIFAYLTISPDLVNNLSLENTKFIICDRKLNPDDIACIEKNRMESALSLLKSIAPKLQTRAVSKKCYTPEIDSFLTQDEIMHYLSEHIPNRSAYSFLQEISDIAYLVKQNAQWQINCIEQNENTNYKKFIFEITNPKLPVLCTLKIKFRNFFLVIGVLAIIASSIYTGWFIIKTIQNYRNERRHKINMLINEIVNAAQTARDMNQGQDYVVLNHLRDKIISAKRNELRGIWPDAIDYLEKNESRLLFDIRMINGEDCKIIKWMDASPVPNTNLNSTTKKWQSPAFDTSNKKVEPPTPCLKIRQMFEKFEANDRNLKTIIQNSIIEKVGTVCKIYEIQIDPKTCCVYVRCATAQDAGMVHDAVNGWWFDNRLVSIKFVRYERYLERFPQSYGGPNCLRTINLNNVTPSTNHVPQHLDDDVNSY